LSVDRASRRHGYVPPPLRLRRILVTIVGTLSMASVAPGLAAETLRPINPVVSPSFFGDAIAAAAGRIVVGAGFEPAQGRIAGAAFVFAAGSSGLLFRLDKPEPGDAPFTGSLKFGAAVTANDGVIVVGAPEQQGNVGAVYVFDLGTGALLRTLHHPDPPLPDPSASPEGFG